MPMSKTIRALARSLPFIAGSMAALPAAAQEWSLRFATDTSASRMNAASFAALPRIARATAIPDVAVRGPQGAPLGWIEQQVVASDGASGDLFGFRTLVVGDLAFVSAPAPLARLGAVYVYERKGGTWTEVQRLMGTPPDGTPPNWSEFFGWSMSLSASGEHLVIGAPDVFSPMAGPAGGVYLFERDGTGDWVESQLLQPPIPIAVTGFGGAVVFSGDTLVVGEGSYNRSTEGGRGAAHVYNLAGGSWTYAQLVQASDGTPFNDAYFGNAVAADAQRVLVGAPGPDYSTAAYPQGAVYVFSNTDGVLSETQKLEAADGAAGDQFGFSIAIDGDDVLVGASAADNGANAHQGAAYFFAHDGNAFAESQKVVRTGGAAFDQFGQSVALSGATALVGMWSNNDEPGGTPPAPVPGTVSVYTSNGSGWNHRQDLVGSAGSDGDSFGWHVAVDGGTLLIGADADGAISQFQGSAYFYENDALFADGFDG